MNTVNKLVAAWNSGDIKAIAACYANDVDFQHVMVPEPLKGRDAFVAFEGAMFQAFSQIDWKAVSVVGTGETLALEFQVSATNSAPMQSPTGPIPATNKRITVKGVSLLKLNGKGEIAEERRYLDTASMFRQLGLA
jgi:steroid delta-isomerase-like uncharacterized protein